MSSYQEKIIKPKLGVLELARPQGNRMKISRNRATHAIRRSLR